MKKFAMLALLLSMSTLTIGCKPAEKKVEAPAVTDTPAPEATPPTTEEKK